MSFDFSGFQVGEVLLAMMLSSKIFVFKPFRIIAGLLNDVLHLVLNLLLFISSILDDLESYYFVTSQRLEQHKNVQLEPNIIK